MLSTGRLLRATKLLCDFKTIEGTKKCSFHVYTVHNSLRRGTYVLRRKQQPIAIGFVNFASSDASVDPPVNPTSQNLETAASLDVIEMSQTQDTFELQVKPVVDMDTAGIPFEQYPVTSQVSDLEELHLSTFEPSNGLELEGLGISVVLLESMFESSVIPEVNSSPLDGSFEPIPLEDDSTRTISQPALDANEFLTSEPTEPTMELKIDPIPTNSHIEAPIESAASLTPDIAATTGGIPELTATSPELLTAVAENVGRFGGEASLQSIGLGSYTPVGLVQQALEFFHVGMDLPWWGAIAVGTLIIRIFVFPLVIMSQRNAAKMNNNLPEMQAIQLKMSDARERGDRLDAARYAQEMVEFMKVKGLNPLKNMAVPMCQAPFFVSMFMGIRAMANAPVESFREGGLWWFMDLTLPDQFYLLPLITSATLALTIELGTDMGRLGSSNLGMMKYLIRGMPLIVFPFTMNFPSGVLVYWCSTNFISLMQVGILRIPGVRDYFKIDRLIKIDKKTLPIKEKGFVGGMKESWTNMKISRELEERERLDSANFLRAGRGAIKKTYKFDPTQPRPPRNLSSIQLKKRD